MITIGTDKHKTKHPADLAERLVAMTGYSPAEMGRALEGAAPPHMVARALIPFLGEDAASMPELASAIAADDAPRIRGEVAALYAAAGAEPQQEASE